MRASYGLKRQTPERMARDCSLAAPLRPIWSVQYDHVLWTLPLIQDGILVRSEPPKNTLMAEDEETREPLWTYRNGSAVAIDSGVIAVYAERGQLDLVDLRTGSLTGVIRCPGPLEGAFVGDSFVGLASDGEGLSIYRASLASRSVTWQHDRPFGSESVCGIFCISGSTVVLGVSGGVVRALSILDGQEVWRHAVTDLVWHDPTFGDRHGEPEGIFTFCDDLVIVRVQHGHVVALSARDGSRVWAWSHGRARTDDGYLYNGRYYVNSGLGTYHVLDPRTGKVLLTANLRATLPSKLQGLSPHGPMLVSETHTFIGTIEGYIVAFERDTGRYVWHHRPKGGTGMGSYLMSANGRLYYTDMSFRLYCLEEREPTDPVLKAQRGKG